MTWYEDHRNLGSLARVMHESGHGADAIVRMLNHPWAWTPEWHFFETHGRFPDMYTDDGTPTADVDWEKNEAASTNGKPKRKRGRDDRTTKTR